MQYFKRVAILFVTIFSLLLYSTFSVAQNSSSCDQVCIDNLQKTIQLQQQQLEVQQKLLSDLKDRVDNIGTQVDANTVATPVAPILPRLVTSGTDEASLTISGQINRGVLYADDGQDTEVYHVDNDNSSTRIRLIGEASPTDNLKVGTQIELQFESNSTAAVNQNEQSAGPNNFTERKLEFYVDSPSYGRLWVGQGDTASNSSAEVDLSGTTVVGYSGLADLAGGILYRDKTTGLLTETSVGSSFSNLDGLSRDDRIRYDTPNLKGFTLSTSAITNSRWDAALRYSGQLGAFKTAAAIAYADPKDSRDDRISGSFSILHDSGINVTAAGGRDNTSGRDPEFWYTNVGYQADFFSVGKTAFSVDYYNGDDIATSGDESESYGIFAVQNMDKYATQFYIGFRSYDLDTSSFDAEDIFAILAGARIKF